MRRRYPSRKAIRNVRRIAMCCDALAQVSWGVDTTRVVDSGAFVPGANVWGAAFVDGLGEPVTARGTGGSFICDEVSDRVERSGWLGPGRSFQVGLGLRTDH